MDRIEHVNALHDAGHEIIIATARGAETGIDWLHETAQQLQRWGLRYDRLEVGDKPFAHAYVDDRAVHCDDFFGGD
jgi:carbamoyl-phosphate synthase large subunit